MSDWPANPLNPFPSHRGLGDESFTYVAPLRASEPLVLKVPTQSPQDRSKRSRAPSNRLYNDHVWNAAMYLADAICAGELDVEGKRVLELGAGIGLPSMLAAMKGAERVVASDYNDEMILAQTRYSIDKALAQYPEALSRVQIIGHTWGEDITALLEAVPDGHYDIILLSDVFWDPKSHHALLSTLSRLLTVAEVTNSRDSSPADRTAPTKSTVYFAAGMHSGRQVLRDFFSKATTTVMDVHVSDTYQPRSRVSTASASGQLIPVESEWFEISVKGERRLWRWSKPDCNRDGTGASGEASQEERNQWTLFGSLQWCPRKVL